MGFPGRSVVKNPPANSEMQAMLFQSLGGEDPLEEETTTHSSILAWRIPWTEEPGGPWGCKESDTAEAESWIELSMCTRTQTDTYTHTHTHTQELL